MEEEKVEISNCPICGGRHVYKLEVERDYVLHLHTSRVIERLAKEQPKPKRVTRIFVCPVKNEKFQASFILYQTSNAKIKSVRVKGVIENESE